MIKRLFIAALLAGLSTSIVNAGQLKTGTAFPLSDGAAPKLMNVEVHHVTSDNTIDVAVWLAAPTKMPASQAEMLTQLGEFCVRYFGAVMDRAAPSEDRRRVFTFVPLYTVSRANDPKKLDQSGFAFKQTNGECSLEPPFPQELVKAVEKRASAPLPRN